MGGDIDNEDGTEIMTYEGRTSSGRTRRPLHLGRAVTPRTGHGNEALRGQSTENGNECRGKGKAEWVSTGRAVAMTASQHQMLIDALTASQYQKLIDALRGGGDREAAGAAGAAARGTRLDQVWPGTRPKMDIEATREGEVAVPAHTYEQVVESTELSRPKLDQVWPGTRLKKVRPGTRPRLDIEATREGEVAAPAHTALCEKR